MTDDGQKKRGFFSRLFGFGKAPSEAAPPRVEPKDSPVAEASARLDAPQPAPPITSEQHQATNVPEEVSSSAPLPAADEPTDRGVAEDSTAPAVSRDAAHLPDIDPTSPPQPHEDQARLGLDAADAPQSAEPTPAEPSHGGWFQRLKSGLAKTSSRLTEGIAGVFTKRKLDSETLDELEDLLLQADLGIETATGIIDTLKSTRFGKEVSPEEIRAVMAAEIEKVLQPVAMPLVSVGGGKPHVIMFVGVNGTGKTTTIGKLASHFKAEGYSLILAAGDTFRAAAIEQLKVWGERTGAPVVARPNGADPAGLAFDAFEQAKVEDRDLLLIDTAGRLQNKTQLMDELEKIVRVLRKQDSTSPHQVLLVLDATTGQNALNQVEVFKDRAGVTGLVMTKLDGTARGGILVAISARFKLPIVAIGVGERVDDLQAFDAREFSRAIAGLDR